MNQNQREKESIFHKCATFSLIAGILGIISCCTPPTQLVLGMAAIMLSYISRQGASPSPYATAGMILGAISVALSLLIFLYYVWAYKLMGDPANASLIKEIYRHYQEVFDGLMQTQPAS